MRPIEADGPAARSPAESRLEGAVQSVLALSEGYPALRSADNFRHALETLVDAQDHLLGARGYDSAVVRGRA